MLHSTPDIHYLPSCGDVQNGFHDRSHCRGGSRTEVSIITALLRGGGEVPGPGGVPAPGGCLVLGGAWTATAAGGTHPTRMHSCYANVLLVTNKRLK